MTPRHTEYKDIKIPKVNPKLGEGIMMINTEDENGNSTVKYVSINCEPLI